jgi:hypothetical protein
LVLINDLAATVEYPHYAPQAVTLGVEGQGAIQLIDGKRRAGLNLYARKAGNFDRATVQIAELFATQAGALLGYAEQVENLIETLHTRTDIATAVGVLMGALQHRQTPCVRLPDPQSQHRNLKVRVLAQQVIDGMFQSTLREDNESHEWL